MNARFILIALAITVTGIAGGIGLASAVVVPDFQCADTAPMPVIVCTLDDCRVRGDLQSSTIRAPRSSTIRAPR